jgi:adenylate kinase family enzyme
MERAVMMSGKVLDDSIVTPIVRDEIRRLGDSPEILLDGCPRTVGQAVWLASAQDTPKVRLVIHMVASDEVALERLTARAREDDSPEAMCKRFAGYHRDINLVLNEFKAQSIPIFECNADEHQDNVFELIREAIAQL